MAKLIALQGLPASGKSTYSKELVRQGGGQVKRVNKDDLRDMLDDGRWSKKREETVRKLHDSMVVEALNAGFDVVADNTNLTQKHLDNLKRLAKAASASFEVVSFLDVPVDECIRRNRKRENQAPEYAIRRMAKQVGLDVPAVVEDVPAHPALVYDANKPYCIICDLDGTLALHNGRDPYDASTCDKDKPNWPIHNILETYQFHDLAKLVFCSGREDCFEEQTRRFLKFSGLRDYELFMRQTGDKRPDWVVKEEILFQKIAPKYNVLFVLDDRDSVVAMWRRNGLTCLQVAYGKF